MAQGPSDTILVALRITLRIRESKVWNPDPPYYSLIVSCRVRRRFVLSEHILVILCDFVILLIKADRCLGTCYTLFDQQLATDWHALTVLLLLHSLWPAPSHILLHLFQERTSGMCNIFYGRMLFLQLVWMWWQSIQIVGASACVIFILLQKILKMAKCTFWYRLTRVVPAKSTEP